MESNKNNGCQRCDDRAEHAENLRFYGDSRFKQLTLFLAGITVIAGGMVQFPNAIVSPRVTLGTALAVAGMLFTGVMWVMELRSVLCWWTIWEKVPDLWPRPRGGFVFLTSTYAVGFLKLCSYTAFWLWGRELNLNGFLLFLLVVFGLFLSGFAIYAYGVAKRISRSHH